MLRGGGGGAGVGGKRHVAGQAGGRPLSVSFLFRTSGKETEVVTPHGMEKYGTFNFSP